jgi:hypothetical protein
MAWTGREYRVHWFRDMQGKFVLRHSGQRAVELGNVCPPSGGLEAVEVCANVSLRMGIDIKGG